jgi:hypothetical protein
MVYPALLPLMRTARLPVVDWTDAPRRLKWTRPFRRKTKSGYCECAITFQTQSNTTEGITVSTDHHILFTLDLFFSLFFINCFKNIAYFWVHLISGASQEDRDHIYVYIYILLNIVQWLNSTLSKVHKSLVEPFENWLRLSFISKISLYLTENAVLCSLLFREIIRRVPKIAESDC